LRSSKVRGQFTNKNMKKRNCLSRTKDKNCNPKLEVQILDCKVGGFSNPPTFLALDLAVKCQVLMAYKENDN